MTTMNKLGDVFECWQDRVEVTSNRRPDTNWRVVDAQGHEHRWCVNGRPATLYVATLSYETPTLVWIKDGDEYWEDDDEPHAVGHLECRQCGEHIQPGYTADTNRVYIPGLWRCHINGVSVSKEEFERRFAEQHRP